MKTLATVTAIGLLGCVDQPELGTTAGMSFEEFQTAASAHREPGTNAYILDGDIAIHSDAALYDYWKRSQQGALSIYAIGGTDIKWSDAQKVNLTYCIGSTFGANKPLIAAAMLAATDNGWSKFANVKFVYVPAQDGAGCNPSNPNVMFDVNQVNSGGQFLARAFFPDSTRSERNVVVDPSSFDPTLPWPLANILAHELGHALGFRHEHIRAPGNPCPEDNNFRAITPYDSASVMHYPQCGGTSNDLAFTMSDKTGVGIVYGAAAPVNPSPMAMINSPRDGAIVPPTFTVETSLIDTDLVKGELFIDGALYKGVVGGPYTFAVTDLAEGPHQLVVKATDAINQGTAQTINVTVMKPVTPPGGDGDGDGDGGGDGGCTTGGSPAGLGFLAALGLVGLIRRRR